MGTFDPYDSPMELFVLNSSSLAGFCSIFFSFIMHMNIFSVMKDLHNPTPTRKRRVAVLAVLFMTGFYAVVAISGYLIFGADTHADVLTNFDTSRLDVQLANVAMVVMLHICFVLNMYPTRESILELCCSDSAVEDKVWLGTTLGITVCVAIVAIGFPSVIAVLGILGGFCAPCLISVFPALTLRFSESPVRAGILYGSAFIGFVGLAANFLNMVIPATA